MKVYAITDIEIDDEQLRFCGNTCPYKMTSERCSLCEECFLEDASKGIELAKEDGKFLRTIQCMKRNTQASILHKFFVSGEEGLNVFEKNILEDMRREYEK